MLCAHVGRIHADNLHESSTTSCYQVFPEWDRCSGWSPCFWHISLLSSAGNTVSLGSCVATALSEGLRKGSAFSINASRVRSLRRVCVCGACVCRHNFQLAVEEGVSSFISYPIYMKSSQQLCATLRMLLSGHVDFVQPYARTWRCSIFLTLRELRRTSLFTPGTQQEPS